MGSPGKQFADDAEMNFLTGGAAANLFIIVFASLGKQFADDADIYLLTGMSYRQFVYRVVFASLGKQFADDAQIEFLTGGATANFVTDLFGQSRETIRRQCAT